MGLGGFVVPKWRVAPLVFRAPEAPAARELSAPCVVACGAAGVPGAASCVVGPGCAVGGGPPASRPRRELRSARRLEARPGPAAAHRHRGRSLRRPPHQWGWVADVWLGASSQHPARPRHRPRALWPGHVDQAARLSETVIAFAGAGRASIETAIAFAGEKWAVLVQFLGAVVMVVSAVPCWGRAVVMVVSCLPASVAAEVSLVASSPRGCVLCATKFALLGLMVGVSATEFALHAQNGPNSVFLRLLGEFYRGNAGGGAVLGQFFRANRCCARSCMRCGALQAAAMGVLRHAKPSSGVSSACWSLGWRHSPRLVAVSSQFAVVLWPNCRPIG